HGVDIRPVDVNFSGWDCTLEPDAEPVTCRSLHLSPQAGRGDARHISVNSVPPRLHPRHAEMADDIRTTHAVRLGFRQIGGFRESDGRAIERARRCKFDSVRDLWLRPRLPPAALERLALADAFRSLGLDRRAALWAVRALRRAGDMDDLPLFASVPM